MNRCYGVLCLGLLLASSAASAQDAAGIAPGLTRPVGQTTVVSGPTATKQGGALSLGAKASMAQNGSLPTPAAPSSKAVTEMVDVSRAEKATARAVRPADGVPEVPRGLASAAMPVEDIVQSDPMSEAMALSDEVAAQRGGIQFGRAAPTNMRIKPGRNEMIQVARSQLNRLVTPFFHPVVKTTSAVTTTKVEGSIVYVATSASDPVGMFIVDEDNPINAISVTLMPRDVPAVSVTLELDEFAAAPAMAGRGAEEMQEQGDGFVSSLRETFRALAAGEVPVGYGMKRLNGYNPNMPECVLPGLMAVPAQEITGSDIVVIVSKLTNRTDIPQSVDESRCASDRVLAVAAWPYVELLPGQSTELFIAVRRNPLPAMNARPSVLN